jgi:serine/threonine-protein kinase
MSTPAPTADRNLIFGLLALQMDFVTREQLLDAMSTWLLARHNPLGHVLRRRGVLTEHRVVLLEGLVDEHLAQHGNPQASLAALTVPPAVRSQLECLDDADVQQSLAALPATTDDLAGISRCDDAATGTAALVGESVRFRRLRAHAKGGLGEVFVALDEELRREVALKEIQARYADHPEARARFLREAEITGRLEHPGVVPVYGLGVYPDGRPFYAMRFIHGQSLQSAISRFHTADEDHHRDPGERSLALRDLLGRFAAVCNAVGYAHSRGIIHRDLKPDNAMLGEYGETLLVDWGLAKPLDQGEGEQTAGSKSVLAISGSGTAETEMGRVVGTVAFMPPEQANGRLDQVGPCSDVFSLGATLYALLTGHAPYGGPDALIQAAMAEAVPARQRKRSVPAALEAVCARAMAAKPEDRYPSAKALAEEVQRWLGDEPVLAYREPIADRLRRWGRRHRSLVSAAVVLLIAGVVGLSLGLWLVGRAEARTARALTRALEAEADARDNLSQAESNLKRAVTAEATAKTNLSMAKRAVDECFNVCKEHPLFQERRMEKAKALLLEKTLDFYKNFREQRPNDPGLHSEEAAQLFRVAYIERALGRSREALLAYRKARDRLSEMVKAHPDVPEHQQHLANTHQSLGNLLSLQGKGDEALLEYRQARDRQRQLMKAHPEVSAYQQDLARTHNNLGILLRARGKREEALEEYRQARDIQGKLVKIDPHSTAYQEDLAGTHHNSSLLLSTLGKRDEALREARQARAMRLKLVKAHPDRPEYQQGLAATHNNLGMLLSDLGKGAEALEEYRYARSLFDKLVKAHPDLPEYQKYLASTHNNLGALLRAQGKLKEALTEFRQARDRQNNLVKDHPELPAYRNDLALTHYNLGVVLDTLGNRNEALTEYQQARDLLGHLVKAHPDRPEYQQHLARTHHNMAVLLHRLGKDEEALKEHRQARDLLRKLVKAHPDRLEGTVELARTSFTSGSLLARMNRLDDSLADLTEGITRTEHLGRLDPRNPNVLAFLLFGLPSRAKVLLRLRKPGEADADWDRVLKLAPADWRFNLRFQRTDSRARAGDYLRSALEAEELARDKVSGAALYLLSCIHALNAGSVARDVSRPLPERDKRAEQYAMAALALLQRAKSAGYFRDPAKVADLDKISDLAFLRDRDDFKRFRAELNPAK